MLNLKKSLFVAFLAITAGAMGQTCPTELVNKNNLSGQIEKGHAIDTYGSFTILGSKGKGNGLSDGAGGALLFNNGQYLRTYEAGVGSLGVAGTVAIDNQAIVLGSPRLSDQLGNEWGGVALVYRNGGEYSTQVNAWLIEGSGQPGTGFGSAVGISNDWIAVGAPGKGADGAVKMFRKNYSTGNWDSKGYLPLPDFSVATYRKQNSNGVIFSNPLSATFGKTLAINNNNLIVGAPGIGASYIYELNNAGNWVLIAQNIGSDYLSGPVTISDEYAGSSLLNTGQVALYKKFSVSSGNIWIPFQKITESTEVYSIAMEGSKLIVGLPLGGKIPAGEQAPHGQVKYYEMDWSQGHFIQGTNFWIGNFKWVGFMYVKPECSTLGLKNHKLLGSSVAIQGDIVVAGAPNAYYLTVADGAGFRAAFSQKAPVTSGTRTDETVDSETTFVSSSYFYPNPANDKINISQEEQIINARATNINGSSTSLEFNGSEIEIADLPPGIYTITVTTVSGVTTENVVVK
jgi:hypothetical protein